MTEESKSRGVAALVARASQNKVEYSEKPPEGADQKNQALFEEGSSGEGSFEFRIALSLFPTAYCCYALGVLDYFFNCSLR